VYFFSKSIYGFGTGKLRTGCVSFLRLGETFILKAKNTTASKYNILCEGFENTPIVVSHYLKW